jgi:hypothetical protein
MREREERQIVPKRNSGENDVNIQVQSLRNTGTRPLWPPNDRLSNSRTLLDQSPQNSKGTSSKPTRSCNPLPQIGSIQSSAPKRPSHPVRLKKIREDR